MRLSAEAFGGWATVAGLAGRLRKRLGRADKALLANVISGWALFSKHSAERRRQKQERADRRSRDRQLRAWDTGVLDVAFADWANATAAGKFRRLRLTQRVFRAWGEVVARASGFYGAAGSATAVGAVRSFLSREKHEARLGSARREADARFDRATQRRMAECFENWARGAGLSSRLRRRLGPAELGLLNNAFLTWIMFNRHAARQRESKAVARVAARRKAEVLRATLWAWADVTAADKFFRLRLRHRVFVGWRIVVFAAPA